MSTLKEKLEQYIDPQINVVHLEKIADDYAIEFAKWIIDTDGKPIGEFTITELLLIFKKEK